jgi:hypothetical protein
MGGKCPSLCIKMMHTTLFIKPVFKVLSVLLHSAHGSIKVTANISQRNREQAIKSVCDISNAPRVQPATLVEYSPNNRPNDSIQYPKSPTATQKEGMTTDESMKPPCE